MQQQIYTEKQLSEIIAYAIAKFRVEDAVEQKRHCTGGQKWLDECINDLLAIGISWQEADTYFTSHRWFRREGLTVNLDEPGAPSEEQCRTYYALLVAADRISLNNGRSGVYRAGKFKAGKPLAYCVTDQHQMVIDAMSRVMAGEMSCEEAMALLNQYDVLKQRLGK